MSEQLKNSKDAQGIIYRDSKSGRIFWDTSPTGVDADKILKERIEQGLVPIGSGSESDVLKIIEANRSEGVDRNPNIIGRFTD